MYKVNCTEGITLNGRTFRHGQSFNESALAASMVGGAPRPENEKKRIETQNRKELEEFIKKDWVVRDPTSGVKNLDASAKTDTL